MQSKERNNNMNKKAQSTVEYIVVVALVLSVCLVAIPKVVKQYEKTLKKTSNQINTMSNRLKEGYNGK